MHESNYTGFWGKETRASLWNLLTTEKKEVKRMKV